MRASSIQINVDHAERELFESAARRSGLTVSEMVKEAVLAYAQRLLPHEELEEALSGFKTKKA